MNKINIQQSTTDFSFAKDFICYRPPYQPMARHQPNQQNEDGASDEHVLSTAADEDCCCSEITLSSATAGLRGVNISIASYNFIHLRDEK